MDTYDDEKDENWLSLQVYIKKLKNFHKGELKKEKVRLSRVK